MLKTSGAVKFDFIVNLLSSKYRYRTISFLTLSNRKELSYENFSKILPQFTDFMIFKFNFKQNIFKKSHPQGPFYFNK